MKNKTLLLNLNSVFDSNIESLEALALIIKLLEIMNIENSNLTNNINGLETQIKKSCNKIRDLIKELSKDTKGKN